MMAPLPINIKKDIDGLISGLLEKGICDDQNFSAIREYGDITDITFSGPERVSIISGNIEYIEIYRELKDKRSFNMRLIDGALLQMMYRVEDDSLLQHRLAFYPSPSLLPFQDDPDSYMQDALFLEIVKRRIIPFPLRFDFDGRKDVHIDVAHPKSHLTLGDVKACRIPVSAPLTPRWFVEFILRNFYQAEKYNLFAGLPPHMIKLSTSITHNETALIHMVIPY